MPAVVPQLKTITLGGAVAGVGIESSSHRYGLVHDTMLELDVLLGDGRVVTCTADNEHRRALLRLPEFLRHARLRAARQGAHGAGEAVRAARAPAVSPTRQRYFQTLGERLRAGEADFIDGTVFAPRRDVPHPRPLRRQRAVHERLHLRAHLLPLDRREARGLPHRARLHLALGHRLVLVLEERAGAQNPLLRRLYGRERLGSQDLYEDHALEQPRRHHARSSSACSACIPNR